MSTSSADDVEAPLAGAASAAVASPLNAGDFMDLDAAAACWPFDPIAAFRSSPPHRLLLPASPSWIFPDLDLSHPPSPPLSVKERILPASPSWIFPDLADLSRPSHPPQPPLSVKERMSRALRNFKDSTSQHVLVQIWAPVRTGDRYVLSTSGQPFVIDPQSSRLLQYRMVSSSYVFELEGDGERDAGIPGRVFRHRLPEWTPNVQYYSSKEYPRLVHALRYDVQGTLALPVFENSGRDCVGVVEMVMTSPMINYASEVDMVCKALEAVNLKSSETLDHPNGLICNDGREAALAEVLEILTVVCEAHKLPLAQTWVPCRHRSILAQGGGLKKSCSSFDGSCMGQVCMSTTDVAFYVIDPRMWGFRDACVEHHLQKGQGVAGRAFESRRACFCADVTQFCKTEYPLVHYARMFGLASCLAICLQSTQSGNDNYILEFFLPPQCKDTTDQQTLLDSISSVMKQCSRSLKVVSSIGLEGESLEIIDVLANENFGLNPKAIISCSRDTWNHTYPVIYPGSPDDSKIEGNAITDLQEQCVEQDINPEKDGLTASCPTLDEGGKNNVIHQRRGKAEKSISLEVLQQYFTGSLKDAAKSLGVCPTTMKRICRQHGISRWPSRKINKVNRSLSKLQQVLESVQGVDGPLKLTSLTGTIPVSAGSICWPVTMVGPMQSQGSPRVPRKIHENGLSVVAVQRDPVHYLIGSQLEADKESDGSKTRSSSEGSLETPSQDSCQGSPAQEIHSDNTPGLQTDGKSCESLGLTSQLLGVSNIPAAVSEDIAGAPVWLLSRMLVEDSGSSKDLRDLCDSVEGGCPDDPAIGSCQNPTQSVDSQKPETVTIKACYKGDIIRFRLPCNAGVLALSDEVAKRLNLEAGMFDIRYLDEDKEWVILACDADLEECIEISRLSGAYVTRFTVNDIAANLGSSYGSSVE